MTSSWFSVLTDGNRPANRPALMRLYCFPYAGASHTTFQHWRALLRNDVDLALVKLPGRGARLNEPPAPSIDALAQSLAQAIARDASRPYAFFGHSMGALLAFETARRLAVEFDSSPAALFISGRTAPSAHALRPHVAGLPDPALAQHVRSMGGMPQEILECPEWLEFFLPIIRADFALCERYQYRRTSPLSCPITVFAGENDAHVPLPQLDGWSQESTHHCHTRIFPGGHFFLFQHESELIREIERRLQHFDSVEDKQGHQAPCPPVISSATSSS